MNVALVLALLLVVVSVFFYRRHKTTKARQCAYGSAEAYAILKKPRNYQPLKALFGTLRTPDERYFYSVSISRTMSLRALKKWVQREPESGNALLCYGARLLQWAWDARGYGRGAEISDAQWDTFFERLKTTRSVLLECAEKSPDDPTPWAYLIMVATWCSDDDDIKYEYLLEAIKRDPDNWPAHMHMIVALSEKWGGSNDAMLEFARNASVQAGAGTDLAAIVVKAHIEYWKYLNIFEEDPEAAAKYINNPVVQSEVVQAYEKSLARRRSNTDTKVSIFARYNISGWFWITRDRIRLEKELAVLEDRIENIHWRWLCIEGELNEAKAFASGN